MKEATLNFDERTGPNQGVNAPHWPSVQVPQWWKDAKLGFFIHWGLYSVPAWATTNPDPVPLEQEYAHHCYAEWYANTVRILNSPTRRHHDRVYGIGTSYEDFADWWSPDLDAPATLIRRIADAGAGYVIPTTKHHDGFCLWHTDTTGFNAAKRGPHQDLVKALHDEARAAGLRFGVYYSGALDWHVGDFGAITSDTELFTFRRNDPDFAKYCAAQLTELIARFRPDILWNDIEWPDAGKGSQPYGLASLFSHYLKQVPEGVVNDRWGVSHHGFLTREYRHVDAKINEPWESTRGLGRSFGYNQEESTDESLSGTELVQYLVDVVAKNGNLLINVGPRADGSIPEVQAAAMAELGRWMRVHDEAIRGTRPWGNGVYGDQRIVKRGETVYVHLLDGDALHLPDELQGFDVSWIGSQSKQTSVPCELVNQPVKVARLTR